MRRRNKWQDWDFRYFFLIAEKFIWDLAGLIPASVVLLGYSWFLTTVFKSPNLAVLILAFSTIVNILRDKQNGIFLNKVSSG